MSELGEGKGTGISSQFQPGAARRFPRIGQVLGMFFGALAIGASCEEEPPPPAEPDVIRPLPQESVVLIEALVGERWVTLPVPQEGAEHLAQLWCNSERATATDSKLCGGVDESYEEWTDSSNPGTNLAACQATLCQARNQVCAGYFLDEMGRTPLSRTLDTESIGLGSIHFIEHLFIDAARLGTAMAKAGISDYPLNATKLRTQPLLAAGRAAALRGALRRYREAGMITAALNKPATRTAPCSGIFAGGPDGPVPTNLTPEAGADSAPTWLDVYYQTFSDAAAQYVGVLPRTLQAMRDSAETQLRGAAPELAEVATQWNGEIDSALAATKLLTMGDATAIGLASVIKPDTTCGAQHKPADVGPLGVPICPPISTNEGVTLAKGMLEALSLKPTLDDPVVGFAKGMNFLFKKSDPTHVDLAPDVILASQNVTAADVVLANEHLCAQTKKTATYNLPKEASATELSYHGAASASTGLPGPVVVSHFSGVAAPTATAVVGSAEYWKSGAMYTLDAMKVVASDLSLSPNAGLVKEPLNASLAQILVGLVVDAGGRRLEFLVGEGESTVDGEVVDQVVVVVHGVPEANGQASEQYGVVHGLAALKCVTSGSIDGAPCDPSDYLFSLNDGGTFVPTPDTRMSDLKGGYLRKEFTQMTRLDEAATPPGPSAPMKIRQDEGLYVVRVVGGNYQAFGGVLPTTGVLILPDHHWSSVYDWVRRAVIVPAGGTYEQVVESLTAANADDCSKTLTTCAGLPADMFPPLESEIVGQPTEQPFEQSWRHYLSLARAAADEADRLGEELVEHGLRMDLRREEGQAKLAELCGVEPSACGINPDGTIGEAPVTDWVTLGDKPVCLWESTSSGKICDRSGGVNVACILALDPNVGPEGCQNVVNTNLNNDTNDPAYVAVPVPNALGLVSTLNESSGVHRACEAFSDLRYPFRNPAKLGSGVFGNSAKREAYIRAEIMPRWNQATIRNAAQLIRYEEHFADHYSLTYGGAPVFDTRRAEGKKRVALESDSIAPCNVTDSDHATGSEFWATKATCYELSNCSEPPYDGCPGNWDGNQSTLSWDTEPGALARRWAWGFGRLRRATAVLGAMTGELNEMMNVAVPIPTVYLVGNNVAWNPSAGRPCAPDPSRPAWVRECKPGPQYLHNLTRCIHLNDFPSEAGPGIENVNGARWGRPVNYNGFLPNALPNPPGYPDLSSTDKVWPGFPMVCRAGESHCEYAGIDPQMVYCDMLDPTKMPVFPTPDDLFERFAQGPIGDVFGSRYSGFIGTAAALPAITRSMSGDWAEAVKEMWEDPGPGFCSDKSTALRGAAWRALCSPPGDEGVGGTDALATGNGYDRDYMVYGELPKPGTLYAGKKQVGSWIAPGYGAYGNRARVLFDIRNGDFQSEKVPFQYPLSQRNMFDAMELACHAQARAPLGSLPDCNIMTEKQFAELDSLDDIAAVLDCFASRMDLTAQRYVVPNIPQLVADAFKKGEPLASTSGAGGRALFEMGAQYEALERIKGAYSDLALTQRQLAFHVRALKSLDLQSEAHNNASTATQWAQSLQGLASAASALSEIGGTTILAGGAKVAAAAFHVAASIASVAATKYQNDAAQAGIEGQRLGIYGNMVTQLRHAESASSELVLALNSLTTASANLALVFNQAAKASAMMTFSDYAGGDKQDPQYVNVVMRRAYNTKLVRYENALARAKKLGFIARRAVELRYGVDLQRMSAAMTLVEAPSTWANEVCELQGIDYAKIRQPNPDSSGNGSGGDVFGSPTPGDDFANAFIGDYVRKLEDFVNSYPIDFPLKDGDDTAVLSMADDLFNVTATCATPGPNLLYWSTEFDKRDSSEVSAETKGWFVSGCEQGSAQGEEWSGCVRLEREPAIDPQGTAVLRTGLPERAVPFRARSSGCEVYTEPQTEESSTCPDVPVYTATGAVTQLIRDTGTGFYTATLYALPDGSADYQLGDTAVMRIVEQGSGAVIAEAPLTFATSLEWTRFDLPFAATAEETYLLEVRPSLLAPTLTASGGPSVFISGAQVEATPIDTLGALVAAVPWNRTDVSRDTIDLGCEQQRGTAFRSQFTRRCEYVCNDGIQKKCPAMDDASTPQACFYETSFPIALEDIEAGRVIPSGQIAIGNFNYRHNRIGVNAVGTGVASCDGKPSSCYANGFLEYSLSHSGVTYIRNYSGGLLPAKMDRANIEHGKMLAAERVLTNPMSSADQSLMEPFTKSEFKGRPIQGLYTLRIWDTPGMQWDRIDDIQLAWRYHYWTRFFK